MPEFFGAITADQSRGVAAALKQGESPVAKVRKHVSGTSCKHDSPTRRAVLKLAVTPPDCRATQNWMDRLRRCSAVNGQHFERYL